jgi:hypothetical protein
VPLYLKRESSGQNHDRSPQVLEVLLQLLEPKYRKCFITVNMPVSPTFPSSESMLPKLNCQNSDSRTRRREENRLKKEKLTEKELKKREINSMG